VRTLQGGVRRFSLRNAYYCGEFGAGSKLKFIANLLVTIHNLSAPQAFVLAERAGLDPDLIIA